MLSNIQMKPFDFKTNSLLEMKWNELPSFPDAVDIYDDPYTWRTFSELRKFAQLHVILE